MIDAQRYEASRPEYPDSIIDWGMEAAGRGLVVELGAGTGKFSRLAHLRATRYLAVEIDAAMAGTLAQFVPDLPVLRGDAHALPLRSGAATLVVAAQAFHCLEAAQHEMARVLQPGGHLLVVWSTGDGDAAPWVHEFSMLLAASPDAVAEDRDMLAPRLADCFAPVRSTSATSRVQFTEQRLHAMTLSHTAYGRLPAPRQDVVLNGVSDVFRRYAQGNPGVVEMPLTTRAVLARRR